MQVYFKYIDIILYFLAICKRFLESCMLENECMYNLKCTRALEKEKITMYKLNELLKFR